MRCAAGRRRSWRSRSSLSTPRGGAIPGRWCDLARASRRGGRPRRAGADGRSAVLDAGLGWPRRAARSVPLGARTGKAALARGVTRRVPARARGAGAVGRGCDHRGRRSLRARPLAGGRREHVTRGPSSHRISHRVRSLRSRRTSASCAARISARTSRSTGPSSRCRSPCARGSRRTRSPSTTRTRRSSPCRATPGSRS